MSDRSDFIENIKQAHAHLLICTEDIKHPLPPQLQKFLEVSEKAVGAIIADLIKEDISAALSAMGDAQASETEEVTDSD